MEIQIKLTKTQDKRIRFNQIKLQERSTFGSEAHPRKFRVYQGIASTWFRLTFIKRTYMGQRSSMSKSMSSNNVFISSGMSQVGGGALFWSAFNNIILINLMIAVIPSWLSDTQGVTELSALHFWLHLCSPQLKTAPNQEAIKIYYFPFCRGACSTFSGHTALLFTPC